MKHTRILALLLAVVMAVSLAACGKSDVKTVDKQETAKQAQEPEYAVIIHAWDDAFHSYANKDISMEKCIYPFTGTLSTKEWLQLIELSGESLDESDFFPDNPRKKLDPSLVTLTEYYEDDAGLIYDADTLEQGMKTFYQKTGVQPYLYVLDEWPDEDEDDLCQIIYASRFADAGHFLVVTYDDQYWYYVGSDAAAVLDEDALECFASYIRDYGEDFEDGDMDLEDFWSTVFSKTANEIMRGAEDADYAEAMRNGSFELKLNHADPLSQEELDEKQEDLELSQEIFQKCAERDQAIMDDPSRFPLSAEDREYLQNVIDCELAFSKAFEGEKIDRGYLVYADLNAPDPESGESATAIFKAYIYFTESGKWFSGMPSSSDGQAPFAIEAPGAETDDEDFRSSQLEMPEADSVSILHGGMLLSELTMPVGAKRVLFAYAGDEADAAAVWTSSDPAVATVQDGIVTAVGAGTATITCTVNGASAACTIRVE